MKNYNEDSHPIESHRRHSGYSQSRILEIERAERAEFLELLHRVERLYNSRSRQIDEIRKRMGFSVHQDTLTSPQTTASPILKDDKRVRTFRTNQTMVEEEPFSKKRLGLGSKMAGWNAANRRNPRTHASLSSVDMPTPTELRAISKVSLFTPSPPSSPPPRATRRPSCLPVITTKFGGAVKEVADGCKLQSSQTTLEGFMETLEKGEFRHHPSPEPPTAPSRIPKLAPRFTARPSKAVPPNNTIPHRGTPAMAPKVPAPPLEAAPAHRKGPRRGFPAVAPKVPAPPSEAAPPNRSGLRCGTPTVAPRVPAPPLDPPPAHRKGPRRGTLVVAPKFPAPPSEAAQPNRKGPHHGTKCHPNEDL
ncbi:proline-rich protein 36 [Etheostoma spectabile]|uniref:proline-rich protein 36 n=1 Tax=Etheostoma spectabile TaxID=54343 RepID=UPI0013AFE167|nr:proline-rich protein 36-like [Etheostoma spectabile]